MELSESRLNPDRIFFVEKIKFDKHITRAKGNYLYDKDGNAYLDFLAQFGAIPFGYNPDCIWDSLSIIRSNEEPSFIQPFISEGADDLARELVRIAPGKMRYVTFTNSGAESVEVAIKMARAKTQRPIILGTQNSFHGKTLGAVSVTSNSIYKKPFLLDTSCFDHVPFGDIDALKARLSSRDVAAFIVEPVQGEGGMKTPPANYLSAAAELCREFGTLFVLDEIQTGLGRTGYLFAANQEGVEPDILLLAKALGGGLVPIGACIASKRVWTSSFGKYHSSTFANSHLTCSVGLAALRHLLRDDQALIKQVYKKGLYLRNELERLVKLYPKAFSEVDGQGLMQGLSLAPWSGEDSYAMSVASTTGNSVPLVCGYLLNEHHILTCPALNQNNVLRIEPPLTIEIEEIDRLIIALEQVAKLISRGDFANLLSYTTDVPSSQLSVPSHCDFAIDDYSGVQMASPSEKCLGKFAFLIHPTEVDDILRIMPASLKYFSESQKQSFVEWVESWCSRRNDPGIAYHMPAIRSKQGGYAEGWLVCSLLRPEQMLRLSPYERKVLMEDYFDECRLHNVDIIGLGAFTSVITRAGTELVESDIPITTGNSLTAMASAESLKFAAKERGINLLNVNVGVIGATGSVGRLVCKSLIFDCGHLTLFGNPSNPASLMKLQALAGELYQDLIAAYLDDESKIRGVGKLLVDGVDFAAIPETMLKYQDENTFLWLYFFIEQSFKAKGCRSPIRLTVDLEQYLPTIAAVVSATSQGYSFIDPDLLAAHAIVCDAARPPDVRSNVKQKRKDIFVYEGGLIRLPEEIKFGSANLVGLPRGVNLACLSETIALAMSGVKRSYSIGNSVPLSEAQEVMRLAQQHGFEILMPSCHENVLHSYSESLSSWNRQLVTNP